MRSATAIRRGAGLTAAAAIAMVGLVTTTTPAEATTVYKGKVTANGGLTVRSAPSTHSGSKSTIARGKTITIDCKVPGSTVNGNKLWYALSGNRGWVTARYVDNIGAAPKYCPASDTEYGAGRTTAAVNLRSGPHFNDAKAGTLPKGRNVTAVCYVKSSAGVDGNHRWYLLKNDSWVAAAYVKRLSTPGTNWVPCAE
jgi:uncharacterized protein YraI